MAEGNGGGKSRLDRIEEMIERQERANEAAHARFEAEDKRLLTAQILMADAMAKTNIAVEKIAHNVEGVVQNMERMGQAMERMVQSMGIMVENMDKLELKMAETTEKLDALIKVVDGIIQRPPAEGRQ